MTGGGWRVMADVPRAIPSLALLHARLIELRHTLSPATRIRNARYLRAHTPAYPVPPARLLVQVAGSADVAWFLSGGALAYESIRSTLARHGRDVTQLASVLDFGCGCGRVLRHWPAQPERRLHGVDYNPALIAWCRRHLPLATFGVNRLEPPLELPSASFDLIYALSVFTHLTDVLQRAWIDEFHRLLAPDGLLLLTVHGEHYRAQLSPAEQATFDRGELVVRQHTIAGTNLCTAFHPPAFVRNALPGPLRLLDHLPAAAAGNPRQDIVLLGRR